MTTTVAPDGLESEAMAIRAMSERWLRAADTRDAMDGRSLHLMP